MTEDWSGSVSQDGLVVARVWGNEEHVRREIAHYAMVYSQDGPVATRINRPRAQATQGNPDDQG